MPKYKSFEVDGYFISSRPMGWRRIFHYPSNIYEAPYFAGDKVKLNLSICQKQKDTLPLTLQVYECFPEYKSQTTQVYNGIIENIGFKKIRKVKIISEDNIAITGDGYYQIVVGLEQASNLNEPLPQIVRIQGFRQTIMTFYAHKSDKVFFAVCGLSLPLIGGIISWFIKPWLTLA